MTRRSGLGARLAALAVGLAATLVGMEAVVRLTNIEPPPLWRFDRSVGWTYRPGLRTWYITPEFRTWVEINSKGLHDREHVDAKTPGTFRILTLGDSYTAALEVPFDDAYPRRLERLLAADGGTTRFEVIDAGVGGYATGNELLMFRHVGAAYHPDLVLLQLSDGDIRDNYERIADANVPGAPYLDLVDGTLREWWHPVTMMTTVERLAGRLRVVRLAYRVTVSAREQATGMVSMETAHSGDRRDATSVPLAPLYVRPRAPEWERAMKITEAILDELNREVSAAGGRLVVLGFVPMQPELLPAALGSGPLDPRGPEAELTAFLDSIGVPHFWPIPPLYEAERREGQPVRFARDRHLTAFGHRRLADVVHDFLRSRALVPGATRGAGASRFYSMSVAPRPDRALAAAV